VTAPDLLVVVLGPFIGSFLLSTALRYPQFAGFTLGRSTCPACHTIIPARDLVPLLSWTLLRGRCRGCATAIGWHYPAVELAAAAIALWSAAVFSGWLLWASCALGWALLALSLIDLRCYRLPDFLTLPLLLGGLGVALWAWPEALPEHLLGAALGYACMAAVGWVYRVLRGRDGIGLGDAKLLAAGGAWLSLQALPGVVLTASVLALAIVLTAGFVRRLPLSAATRVPFGPYLAAGIWLSWLYGPLQLAQ